MGTVVLLSLLFQGQAVAGSDPDREWRTLATEHFQVHYYQGGLDFAHKVADVAEEAWDRCGKFLGFEPYQVVEVVVTDDTDSANGWASVYPYDRIRILAVPPGPESALASYDDYLRQLFYHEYAHILHMDLVSGAPEVVNRVLGKTILPNGATNIWFVEGLATFVETRLTDGGRVGSGLYDMYLRVGALEGELLDLSEMTTTPKRLPRGTSSYVYGGYFLDFLYEWYGLKAITDFIEDYGRRLIPFAMNILARRHFGKDFQTLYAEFLAALEEDASVVMKRVEAEGEVTGRLLTDNGEYNAYPVFTEDSRRVLFVRSDGGSAAGIFEVGLEGGEPRRLAWCDGGCGHLALEPGDSTLLTTHLEYHRIYNLYGDVYRVRLADGSQERLTGRARARDVSTDRDGAVYFVTSEYDDVTLSAFEPSSGDTRDLLPGEAFDGIGSPRPLPSGQRLVFTASRDGQWDLWALDTDSGEPVPLTDDGPLDRDPAPSPDGRWILYSSDHDGVYNIHALEIATGDRYRVTNVTGGAFWPTVSPNGRLLAFSTYSARGYDLAVLPFDPSDWTPLTDADQPPRTLAQRPTGYEPARTWSDEKAYNAWPSFRPRSLRPKLLFSIPGDASRVGAEVSGHDAVGLHHFGTSFENGLREWAPTVVLSYGYEQLFPSLGLELATFPAQRRVAYDDRARTLNGRTWMANFSASLPLPGRVRRFTLGLGYSIRWTTGVSRPVGTDPASLEPWGPGPTRFGSATLSIRHDSTESYAWSISPERGFRAGVSLSLTHPFLGDPGYALTTSGYLYEYLAMPWARGHVLALLWSGAVSRGNDDFESWFALGGFPTQNLLQALVALEPSGTRYLRGFPTGLLQGNTYTLLNVEYRFPIWYIQRGFDTLPAAARALWANVYVDAGGAWSGSAGRDDFRWNLGVELALSTSLFLTFDSTFRLGYARGFGRDGGNVFYFLLAP